MPQTSPAIPPSPPPPAALGPLRAVANSTGYSYLVSEPAAPASPAERGRPLILFLHGAGERGTEIAAITKHGLTKMLAGGPELSSTGRAMGDAIARQFFVIAPQCPHYEVWDERALLSLLDETLGRFAIDRRRVYLTGLSLGGFGAWMLGLRHPGRFAALVPVCGGGRIRDVEAAAAHQGERLRTLGIWAFHGVRDRIVPVEESERMITALHQAGATSARLTAYPEVEHDAWTPAYETPELYHWLLQHTR